MTGEILNARGTRTEPSRARFVVDSERLDAGTQLTLSITAANKRLQTFFPVVLNETVPYPMYIWDWWQYLLAKYDDDCAYANIRLSKVEQITGVDFRFDVYARRQAEFITTDSVEWSPVYATVEPDRKRVYADIDSLLRRRRFKVCPDLELAFDRRVTSTGDVRVTNTGNVRSLPTALGV